MVRADNSGNSDSPSFNIPASKYYWLGDFLGATPKWLFKRYTPFLVVLTFISTSILWLTNWWQIALTRLLTLLFIGQLWPVGWIGSAVFIGVAYLLYKRTKKRLAAERKVQFQKAKLQSILDTI